MDRSDLPEKIERRYCPTDEGHWRVDGPCCPVCRAHIQTVTYHRDQFPWKLIAESGICVHSMFKDDCAGCMVRESMRALGMLLDVMDSGGKEGNYHGLEINGLGDAVRKARWIYERVEEAQGL